MLTEGVPNIYSESSVSQQHSLPRLRKPHGNGSSSAARKLQARANSDGREVVGTGALLM
jgi:hypothetical protein